MFRSLLLNVVIMIFSKNNEIEFDFGDKRLDRRCSELLASMQRHKSIVINQVGSSWSEKMAYYRLLGNDKTSFEKIQQSLADACGQRVSGGHYLVIQDSTQPNYQSHAGRLKANSGLGVIGNNKDLGFFLHPSLVIDANSEQSIGFSDVQLWTRDASGSDKSARNYKSQPIEEKESYRWLDSIEKSKKVLAKADQLTAITDREGDIFELFADIPDARTHLLIRSSHDRKVLDIDGQSQKLFSHLASQPCAGVYQLSVRGDYRTGRSAREAIIEIRYCRVAICPPNRLHKKGYRKAIFVYAVEAKERDDSVPEGEKAIHWRILTTHSIDSLADAAQIIYWYSLRWYIETLFRVLKQKGLDIEQSELETGEAIKKMVILALPVALQVMVLLVAAKSESDQPIQYIFGNDELICLEQVAQTLNGATEKQRNPYPKRTLKWAYWIIARLGGWSGYASQRAAGAITLFRGLKRFQIIFTGWNAGRKDVYKP